jgi:hypothetical protein
MHKTNSTGEPKPLAGIHEALTHVVSCNRLSLLCPGPGRICPRSHDFHVCKRKKSNGKPEDGEGQTRSPTILVAAGIGPNRPASHGPPTTPPQPCRGAITSDPITMAITKRLTAVSAIEKAPKNRSAGPGQYRRRAILVRSEWRRLPAIESCTRGTRFGLIRLLHARQQRTGG